MKDNQRYKIEEIDKYGQPIAPQEVKSKFIQQCGVVVRDYVPIIFREWKPIKGTPDSYVVGPVAKESLWKRLMKNFILPEPEVASDEEEEEPDDDELKRRRDQIEAKVKHFTEKKMAQAFCNWKKRLSDKFIKKEETPDWELKIYMKLKDDWPAFKAYKESEEAKARSAKNAENAKKKKYNHTMGPGGYAEGKRKLTNLEEEYLVRVRQQYSQLYFIAIICVLILY